MVEEDSSDVGRSIQAHAQAMTVLSREVGSRIDAAASKLGQQARLLKILFPVFVGDRDFGEAFGGVNVLPTTFIVDRTGKITARHRGLMDKSEYEKEIEALF